MSVRAPRKPSAQPPTPPSALPTWLGGLLVAVALALAVFFVFRGALGLFFAQEDFRGIAVAKGLLPRHATLWRYVSVQGFMDLFYPLFGDQPMPYHFVSNALHAVNAFLVYALLSRRLAAAAALVAAAFFATHPALFTAVYWQSARSDLLATFFSLCTMALAVRRGRERWLAVPSFALALLSKESIILLPLVIGLVRPWAAGKAPIVEPAHRDPLILVQCLMSGAFGVYLLGGKGAGIDVGTSPDSAYALDFGTLLVQNLITYVGWAADVVMQPSPLRFLDVRNPAIFGLGIASLIAWGIGCLSPALGTRGWFLAGVTFLLLLAPVLPLRNHTYHYLLYAPLAAAAWCVGSALDMAMGLLKPRAVGASKPGRLLANSASRTAFVTWIIACVTLLALTWNGARLVQRMETRPLRVYPALRGDPIVSRAIVAENVVRGLRQANLPNQSELVFVLRERLALMSRIALASGEASPPAEDIYPETNLRTALFEGYGVRALVPGVAAVRFARDSLHGSRRTRFVVYSPTGEVEVYSSAQLDSLRRSPWIAKW